MKKIQLTQGQVALVDDNDHQWLIPWKWYARKAPHDNTYYAVRNSTSVNGKRGPLIQMHRLILGITDPKIEGDHKDHNGLNNQRDNLRICTRSQNMGNISAQKTGMSKYLGVSIKTVEHAYGVYYYWRATIRKNKRTIYLGSFKSEEDAAKAYDKAAKQYHGEFANLNFK